MKVKVVVPIALCALVALLAIKINIRPRSAEGFRDGSRVRVTERTPKEPEFRPHATQDRAQTAPEPPATVAALQTGAGTATHDFDGNGYVGAPDYLYFETCLDLSGPGRPTPFTECRTVFDSDGDEDVDLSDFAAFQLVRGHLPIQLRDGLGETISVDSTRFYNGRQTCGFGGCHDMNLITNGLHFQQGRTDPVGNVIMHDDYFGDGRWWFRGPGRYGKWSPVAANETAPKEAANGSEIDLTAFNWIGGGYLGTCGACHVGGGPGEFDRDGYVLYDEGTGQFGYEVAGKSAADVQYNGDYTTVDRATGQLTLAPWDVTGVSAPDCLVCHRAERMAPNGLTMNWTWRMPTLRAKDQLVDNQGAPIPAYAAAAAAGQGWFSNIEITGSGYFAVTTKLQIDYGVGVSNGSLLTDADGKTFLSPGSFLSKARDQACMGCHGQTLSYGLWFDRRDIHYAKLNRLNDDDPSNDIPATRSTACNFCHPGNPQHSFAKGNMLSAHWRDELDWASFRSCRDCHLEDSPVRHPDAPPLPGTLEIHLAMWDNPDILSCQACHIPYGLRMIGVAFVEATVTGYPTFIPGPPYYSADPLNPTGPDKSRWYPAFEFKTDSDGKRRLFPVLSYPSIYWADWDRHGTPDDFSDDVLRPIIAWRITAVLSGAPLSGVTDDNGDHMLDVNRYDEILAYIQVLKGTDRYTQQIAGNPVLVKGGRIWYEDGSAPGGVGTLLHKGTGIPIEWDNNVTDDPRGLDHNVLAKELAWGYNAVNPELGCPDCHRPATFDSPVFDRLILVDPFGPDGQPVYETVRQMTALNPP